MNGTAGRPAKDAVGRASPFPRVSGHVPLPETPRGARSHSGAETVGCAPKRIAALPARSPRVPLIGLVQSGPLPIDKPP